jgi:hypothetical protein
MESNGFQVHSSDVSNHGANGDVWFADKGASVLIPNPEGYRS